MEMMERNRRRCNVIITGLEDLEEENRLEARYQHIREKNVVIKETVN